MVKNELIQILNEDLDTELFQAKSEEALLQRLSEFINELIQNNFHRLMLILYKVDISENKLKTSLQDNVGQDAASVIAKLIVEREIEKMNSRNSFSSHNDNSNEERW
jgi:hypothetical protein